MVLKRVLDKLKQDVGSPKTEHCEDVMALFDLEPGKVGVRCVTSKGGKHPVALLFRVVDSEIPHNILKDINNNQWVKACYINIGANKVTQFKVVVS